MQPLRTATLRQVHLWNPLKRTRYVLRTTLSPDRARDALMQGMNDYNDAALARERCVLVTAIGDGFSAHIEPFSIGQKGSGKLMSHFVVRATGTFEPARDGRVTLIIGFARSISLFQVIWRLLFVAALVLIVLSFLAGSALSLRALILAIIFGPTVLPWSTYAYFKGMRQAGRDWADLEDLVRASLGAHAFERA